MLALAPFLSTFSCIPHPYTSAPGTASVSQDMSKFIKTLNEYRLIFFSNESVTNSLKSYIVSA